MPAEDASGFSDSFWACDIYVHHTVWGHTLQNCAKDSSSSLWGLVTLQGNEAAECWDGRVDNIMEDCRMRLQLHLHISKDTKQEENWESGGKVLLHPNVLSCPRRDRFRKNIVLIPSWSLFTSSILWGGCQLQQLLPFPAFLLSNSVSITKTLLYSKNWFGGFPPSLLSIGFNKKWFVDCFSLCCSLLWYYYGSLNF